MFSKNNKISKRQIFRLLSYDLLGIGTLLLPTALAKTSGRSGMAALLAGLLAGLLFTVALGGVIEAMKEGETYPAYLKRSFGKILGTVFVVFYIIYYLVLGGYSTYVFGHLIVTELLKEQSYYWVSGGILLLACYGISQGIEGRARVYEILFWFLMLPLFFMLFLAAKDVEVARLFPLFEGEFAAGEGNFYGGCLYSFCIFSLCSFMLFLVPFAREKKKITSASLLAVVFCGGVLLVLYGILQGIFGTESMKSLEHPAVTLMSMVQIPGGFLERQDALMVAVWFFTVFALLGSSLFYVSENMVSLYSGVKRKYTIALTAVLFFLIGVECYRSKELTENLFWLISCYGTPVVVAIPLLSFLAERSGRQKKRTVAVSILLCFSMSLAGCSTVELENRNFPLAMGVDLDGKNCRVSYKFQDLAAVAGENSQAGSGTDFFIKDKDFYTAISEYANDSNKEMDYNHLKTLILSEDFLEDEESLKTFLQICEKEALIARNTLLFLAEDAGAVLGLDKNLDTAIGTYLEELIESRQDYKLKDTVTLGDLMNDGANREQLLLIPVLHDKGGLPVIRNYYAVEGGKPKGEISLNQAMLSYLTQGKIKELSFSLDNQIPVKIKRVKAKRKYEKDDHLCRVELALEASLEEDFLDETWACEKLEQEISGRFSRQLSKAGQSLKDKQGIDITNSFYLLGMEDQETFSRYRGDLEGYGEDLGYKFSVEVKIVN